MAIHLLVILVAVLDFTAAFMGAENVKRCLNPRMRKEWRQLSSDEQAEYIRAVKCMMVKPPISKQYFSPVTSRYDDFVALHTNATGGGIHVNGFRGPQDFKSMKHIMMMSRFGIHNVGVFLPWHRYLLWIWESTLQTECGFTGTQPYWDWFLDTPSGGGSWMKSPLFADNAFGGNGMKMNGTLYDNVPSKGANPRKKKNPTDLAKLLGANNGKTLTPNILESLGIDGDDVVPGGKSAHRKDGTGGGCVTTGPFVGERLHIGPFGAMKDNNKDRCLTRNFNPKLAESSASKQSILNVLSSRNFGDLRTAMERPNTTYVYNDRLKRYIQQGHGGDLHTVGHSGVGAEMADVFTSTNDPLFWLHHANIDRMWWLWQSMDLPHRFTDVAGGPYPKKMTTPAKGSIGEKEHNSMPRLKNMTLNSPIYMGFAAVDMPVGTVVDIQNRDGKGFLCYDFASGLDVYGLSVPPPYTPGPMPAPAPARPPTAPRPAVPRPRPTLAPATDDDDTVEELDPDLDSMDEDVDTDSVIEAAAAAAALNALADADLGPEDTVSIDGVISSFRPNPGSGRPAAFASGVSDDDVSTAGSASQDTTATVADEDVESAVGMEGMDMATPAEEEEEEDDKAIRRRRMRRSVVFHA